MNLAALRTVVCLSIAAIALAAVPAGNAAGSARIVGGTKVDAAAFDATYSSTVSVQANFGRTVLIGGRRQQSPDTISHTCGGTLIAPTLVLTAAHCVSSYGYPFGSTGTVEVLTGTETLRTTRTTAGRYDVVDTYVHPRFGGISSYFGGDTNAPGFDVAVLRLAKPVSGITPMPIVSAAEDAAVWGAGNGRASGAVALGWGVTGFPPRVSFRSPIALRSVGLVLRADRRCERSDEGLGYDARDFDRATMLCAGTEGSHVRAVCFGDSGGPLLAPAADGSLRIVGISSWTTSSKPCASWSVFTRVASVRDWIQSIPAAGGGATGIQPPVNVTSTVAGVDELQLAWDAPTSGPVPTRYRIYQRAQVGSFGGLFGVDSTNGVEAFAGATDAQDLRLKIDGVEPQRAGQSETRAIRVDSQGADGNRVRGAWLDVPAPVDRVAPTATTAPRVRDARRGSQLIASFRRSTDNDCVNQWLVQAHTRGGAWRTRAVVQNPACGSDLLQSTFGFYFGYWGSSSRRVSTTQSVALRGLDADTYAVRVLSVDRAGNARASRTSTVTVTRDVPGRGVTRICSNTVPFFYCPGRNIAVPVDVVVS